MNAITFGRNGGWARNPIDLKIERVSAINSVVEHDAWQVMTDWFTSPYWHAPPHLTEMLTVSKSEFEPITSSHFQLTESTASAAIRQIAGIKVDVDPVAFSLVDQFVFGNTIRGGARTLATSICRGERDDVVIELDSGHAATASLRLPWRGSSPNRFDTVFPKKSLTAIGHSCVILSTLTADPT